jgi:hypothetical protein
MRTCIIPSKYYHVKGTPSQDDRLAVVLLNIENPPRNVHRVLKTLNSISEVKRYGAIFGQWDRFAEVRYKEADDLYPIVNRIGKSNYVLKTTSILTVHNVRQEGKGFR